MSEPDVSQLLSVSDAIAIIDSVAVTPRVERRGLLDCAGLVLAEDLRADRDEPPFVKSLMDGYAVRAADLAGGPCQLAVVGRIMAGEISAQPLLAGQAMKIMTGAPLPAGADAVVAVEFVETSANGNLVNFHEAVPVGKAIAQPGSDITRGTTVLEKGQRLGPAQIAVAASVGAAAVAVFAPPKVAVLGTGDEIVGFDQTPGPTQIRSCNNAMLTTLLRGFGCTVRDLGIYVDDPHHIAIAIEEGLRGDVLFISGGMSMGDRDFVPGILRDMGGELLITKLRIRPGKPFVFARMPGGKFVFGLPGNPVSAFVCASRLARRLLDRIAGGVPIDPIRPAILTEPLSSNGPRDFYQPAIVQVREGKAFVQPLRWKGSADIYTLARANALIVRPMDKPAQKAGADVSVMEI